MTADEKLIQAFSSGIEEGQHASVFLQSPHYVIFKIAGHSSWNGRWTPRKYVRTQYILIAKGIYWLSAQGPVKEWQGRVSPGVLQEWLNSAEAHHTEVLKKSKTYV